ncbi:MAG: hypothetical protein K2H91_14450 [Lachnospiraceae bacterium]|nr:hypothetical protein [Lachnospiraceae bacterium]
MGIYLNPDNKGFQESIDSRIYVDKTGLISCTNDLINTLEKIYLRQQTKAFWKIYDS